jgi:hypothetical protein
LVIPPCQPLMVSKGDETPTFYKHRESSYMRLSFAS